MNGVLTGATGADFIGVFAARLLGQEGRQSLHYITLSYITLHYKKGTNHYRQQIPAIFCSCRPV